MCLLGAKIHIIGSNIEVLHVYLARKNHSAQTMKGLLTWVCVGLLCAALAGCDKIEEQKNKASDAIASVEQLGTIVKDMKAVKYAAAQEHKARVARGDTTPMPQEQLVKFLPTSVSGYTAKAPAKGEIAGMDKFSYSKAQQTWISGNKTIEFELSDMNGAQQMFGMMTAVLKGFSVDNESETVKPWTPDLKGLTGLETYKKKTKAAVVFVATPSRFFLSVKGTNIDNIDELKKEIIRFDWAKLLAL